MKSILYQKLIENGKSDFYGFHMPGHKRNISIANMENPFLFDITEIDGFDNLHNPEGIIKEEMDLARKLYKSKKTYFLVNGSSAGNLAAISSVAENGDKIIIARNSHKSIYNAVELLQLKVEYLYPQMIEDGSMFGSYAKEDVGKIVKENSDAKALVITSPTYEGIVSDVQEICNIAHKYNIPVIVDAAHGAHFILSDKFPKTPVECGADIVIESLHKTLPSLTQTAVLHYNSKLVTEDRVEKYLAMYQSSSPSYVLMASVCNCLEFIRKYGEKYGNNHIQRINKLKENLNILKNMKIFDSEDKKEIYNYDYSKIVIFLKGNCSGLNKTDTNGISGMELKKILNEKYHLEMEMASGNYVIAMTSILDTDEGFYRLETALKEIDIWIDERIKDSKSSEQNCYEENTSEEPWMDIYKTKNEKVSEIYQAVRYNNKLESVVYGNEIAEVKKSENEKKDTENTNKKITERKYKEYVSYSYIYLYPPGIPIVVPGEKVSVKLQETLEKYKMLGYDIISTI